MEYLSTWNVSVPNIPPKPDTKLNPTKSAELSFHHFKAELHLSACRAMNKKRGATVCPRLPTRRDVFSRSLNNTTMAPLLSRTYPRKPSERLACNKRNHISDLNIHVAERSVVPTKPIVCLKNGNHIGDEPLEINLPASRGPCTAEIHHSVDAVIGVLHLPNPPEPIQHSVVEVEYRVAGRAHGIAARVAAGDVVAGGVDAPVVGFFARGWRQQGVVEGVDVVRFGDEVVRVVGRGAERRVDIDVAAHAARVGAGVVWAGVPGQVVHHAGGGAEADDHAVGDVSNLDWFFEKSFMDH